ncbi:MAG TPA: hypothetical protein VHE35_13500 [Kofleriaceae bacterium]|nr:hypothetical protein [Kofleriaceae bacterium]
MMNAADLDENRRGRISPGQAAGIRRSIRSSCLWLAAIVAIAVAMPWVYHAMHPAELASRTVRVAAGAAVIAIVLLAVLVFVAPLWRRMLADLATGEVERVEGKPTHTYRSPQAREMRITIDGVRLRGHGDGLWKLMRSHRVLRVYYLRTSGYIVSAEPAA